MHNRGQGAFEYLLLLGGTVLVATVITVMAQGSISGANNSLDTSSNDFGSYITGGVKDLVANGSLVHESPAGCVYNNPACDVGYYCNTAQNVCTPITSVQLLGYAFDYSGNPLSGVTINVTGGNGSVATTDASGRYELIMNVSQASAPYSVTASRSPANAPAGATVNLTVGYATVQNFTLSYNDASLSGYVRDASSAGISGVNVSCGRYSVLSTSSGSYALTGIPMNSVSVSCTLTGTKSPTVVSNSTPATLSAGLTNSKNLQLSYSPATLSGYIRNTSGSGINGALVSCAGSSATTSSNGSYVIGGIAMSSASTTCTLAASSSPTFVSNSTSVALNAGTSSSGVLQLSYANAVVRGKVNDSSGVALSGVNVSCGSVYALSNATGHYALIVPMSNASWTCIVGASKSPTFVPNSVSVSFSAGQNSSRVFTLGYANATVSGFVNDSAGAGLNGATVSCGGVSKTTSSTGAFSISVSMSAAGSYCNLSASKAGLPLNYSNVSLAAGSSSSASLKLGIRPAVIAGSVVNLLNAGINGANVSCNGAWSITNSAGAYSFSVPITATPTTCTLKAAATNYTTLSVSGVSLVSGSTTSAATMQMYDGVKTIASPRFPNGQETTSCSGEAYFHLCGSSRYRFTISLWFKIMPRTTGTVTLLSSREYEGYNTNYRGITLQYYTSSPQLHFRLDKDDSTSTPVWESGEYSYLHYYGKNLSDGAWHHFAVTGQGYFSDFFEAYLDGALVNCLDSSMGIGARHPASGFHQVLYNVDRPASGAQCGTTFEYGSTDSVASNTALSIGSTNMYGITDGLQIYDSTFTDAQLYALYTSTRSKYS